MNSSRSSSPRSRRGTIVVLTVFLLIGMVGMIAFALDLGFFYTARTEMQRSADAAALAATWRLLEDEMATLGEITKSQATINARGVAEEYAGLNYVTHRSPELAGDDVLIGHYVEAGAGQVDPSSSLYTNTVQVRVQRTAGQNGEVRTFFGRALGIDHVNMQVAATAAFWSGFKGFQMPKDGSSLGILPIALDRETYEYDLVLGNGADNYSYNSDTGVVTAGPDGIPEVNLFPQGTGSPGNRGTVDFGNTNNATPDLQRQILYGLNQSDLDLMGGSVSFDANGELILNGDTGLSAALKTQLSQIIGEPRMIPIFDSLSGNGNNANYTVTAFTGVRILYVKLTGAMRSKTVVVQPAAIKTRGGIRGQGGLNRTTLIYSPVALVK